MSEGGRIEIPIGKYRWFTTRIDTLEKKLSEARDKNIVLNTKLSEIKETIEELAEAPLFRRLFSWNKTITPLIEKLNETK